MSALRVSPWRRYGHDRLYVSLPDGTDVAWLDRATGRVTVLLGEYRQAALDVLAPYLIGGPGSLARSPSTTLSLHPDDDLAPNRPGEALHAKLAEAGEPATRPPARRPPTHLPSRLLRKLLLGREDRTDVWRRSLAGEQIVGADLDALGAGGCRVLHSVPLQRDMDIDHLLTGPCGVFCVRTAHHSKARIRVAEDSVRVGRGEPIPYVRWCRHEAERASLALTRGCGFAVDVQPVLVFVGAAKILLVAAPHDVQVLHDREVPTLGAGGGVLKPADIETIFAVARDRRTWLGV